ncbi:MAG TPA: hypothetical protein VE439_01505 [Anaerolineae bacterium]|nr:hypothetical protein [Anaerolineae bacterium]
MRNLTAKRLSRDNIVILITAIAIVLSSVVAIAMAAKEAAVMSDSREGLAKLQASLKGVKRVKKYSGPKPSIDPVTLLPPHMKGCYTNARHEVPGSDGRASEAIFEPSDEKYTVKTPLTTYVVIRYHGNDEAADEALKKTLETRFSKEQGAIMLDSKKAYSGFSNDYGSYFIGWPFKGFSIKVITSYTNFIPKDPKKNLRDIGEYIAPKLNTYAKNPRFGRGE